MVSKAPSRGLSGKALQRTLSKAGPYNLDRGLLPASTEPLLQRHSFLPISTFLQFFPAAREEQTPVSSALTFAGPSCVSITPFIPLQCKGPSLKRPLTLLLLSGPHSCFHATNCPLFIEHVLCARHCAQCQRSRGK